MSNKKRVLSNRKIQIPLLMIYDIAAIMASYFFALWFRFDCMYSAIPHDYLTAYAIFCPIYAVVCIAVFYGFRFYNMIWSFVGFNEFVQMMCVSGCMSLLHIFGITILFRNMPISYYLIGMCFQTIAITGIRVSYRLLLILKNRQRTADDANRVMIIGAGSSGKMIIRDLHGGEKIRDKVVCAIDDNPGKKGRFIEGVPIVGNRDDILANVKKYNVNKIFLAMPSATAADKRDILNICSETDCELKQLPSIYQLVNGQVSMSDMKNVSVEDLLGREPIKTDMKEVFDFINGKVVLVTGGGGSIGSELCRQVAAHHPKQLIIFDIYENNAYEIQLELREKYPDLNLETLIGSVRDSRRIFEVFEDYRPDIVYHAAAHKHVPLMEDSPCEAIKNNASGTYKTAYAAMTHGCQRFVLISTDKAVNPTNIMGASKRICEMIIQTFDEKIKSGKANELPQFFTHGGTENADKDGTGSVFKNIRTEFVAVRFGNVLGSNGSVIPIFKKQIEKGGPVTVTHPDIIRYFMTIPEAVSLVMMAGTIAHGGEIFVLDMGSPVKIDTLARNLIKLSGFRPDVDIKIEYSGLRPGEKLYEEKLMSEEGLTKTANDLIYIGKPIPFDADSFLVHLDVIFAAAYKNKDHIKDAVADLIGTYKPAEVYNSDTARMNAVANEKENGYEHTGNGSTYEDDLVFEQRKIPV